MRAAIAFGGVGIAGAATRSRPFFQHGFSRRDDGVVRIVRAD
jgi:hypothetical protein